MSDKRRNVRISFSRVMKAAKKRLPFLPDDKIRAHLAYVTDDVAEAYRAGAEEAQNEIIRRLSVLADENKAIDKVINK